MRAPARSLALVILTATLLSTSAAFAGEKYLRKEIAYETPKVTLINQMGDEVFLPDLLDGDRFVMVDFVYATCTTICPSSRQVSPISSGKWPTRPATWYSSLSPSTRSTTPPRS